MNDKTRKKKQADAILGGAPEIKGRPCDMSSVGRMLVLERSGNKYFGGDKTHGDIEAMTEVLFVATRDDEEIKRCAKATPDEWDNAIIDFSADLSMDDINAFGRYFESILGEINASSAEPVEDPKSPGKPKAE